MLRQIVGGDLGVAGLDVCLWRLRLVCLSLEDLQVGPEDVAHEQGGAGDEVLLVHSAELLPRHGQTGDETVNMRSRSKTELSDGPRQPVCHMLHAPVSWISRYPHLIPDLVPSSIRGLENITDTFHITVNTIILLFIGWR